MREPGRLEKSERTTSGKPSRRPLVGLLGNPCESPAPLSTNTKTLPMKASVPMKPMRLTKAQTKELNEILKELCKELKKTPKQLFNEITKRALDA